VVWGTEGELWRKKENDKGGGMMMKMG